MIRSFGLPAAPWERLPAEPAKAWNAFTHYRDLGPARSIEKAARAAGSPSKRRHRQWGRWSSGWAWVPRAAAFDADQDRRAQAAYSQRLIAVRERHAHLAAAALAAIAGPVRAALDALRDPTALQAMTRAAASDPRALMALLDHVARHAHVIAALVNVERLALGMSTEAIEVEDRRELSPMADAIAADPIAADLAIQLLDQITGNRQMSAPAARPSPCSGADGAEPCPPIH